MENSSAEEIRRAPIAELQLSLAGEDLDCIRAAQRTADLADLYRAGRSDQLPPVLLRGGRVIDGHHRVLAATMAGASHVWVTESLLRAFGPAVPAGA